MRWRGVPKRGDAVITSGEVLAGEPAMRVIRFESGNWMFLAGTESDESEPIHVHDEHVETGTPVLAFLTLRDSGYALWSIEGGRWVTYSPMTDDEIDQALSDGTVDREQTRLQGPRSRGCHS